MTSEAKVRQVWPDAVCRDYENGSHVIRIGCRGIYLGSTEVDDPRRAWADAWRTIERQHRENVAKVEAAYPGHTCLRANLNGRPHFIYHEKRRIAEADGHPYHVYALAARQIDEATVPSGSEVR